MDNSLAQGRQYNATSARAVRPKLVASAPRSSVFAGCAAEHYRADNHQMIGYPFSAGTSVEEAYVVTDSGACTGGCAVGTAAANQYLYPDFFTFDGTRYQVIRPGDTFEAWSGYWALVQPAAAASGARLQFALPP